MGSENDIISRFDIVLDAGPEPIFKGGELITGKLLIELRKPIVINAVKLQMKGRAAWLNDPKKLSEVEKIYFDQDFTLLERPPGKPEPGHFTWIGDFTYSLPFECPLPKGCPSSYEGPHAFIRYFIRASLVQEDEHEKIHEYYVKKAFTLVSPSEGHLVVGEGAVVTDSADVGSCCCKSKMSAELRLPKTGYLPGEAIMGDVTVSNKYPKDVFHNMEARLVDRVRRLEHPEKIAVSPYRTLVVRKIESMGLGNGAGKKAAVHVGVVLLTVPPVVASTKGDFDEATNGLHKLSPYDKMLESPSTATLRFRKIPFMKIEYAVQLTLGTNILLEIPVEIGELSTRDTKNTLLPFIVGPQPVEEEDEKGKIAVGGPFVYTPVYPWKEQKPEDNGRTMGLEQLHHVEANERHPLLRSGSQSPTSHHSKSIITTTRTVVTHSDEHEAKTMEETVVESEGEVTRTIEETVVDDAGIETRRIETMHVDAAGNEKTVIEEAKTRVAESAQVPRAIQEARDKIEKFEEEIHANPDAHKHHVTDGAEAVVLQTKSDNDDVTTVSTEVFEEGATKTVLTTTVTHHADGSESTLIQENTTTEVDDFAAD